MSLEKKLSEFGVVNTHWFRLLARGGFMLGAGCLLAAFTLLEPNVMLFHGRENSWLPICSFVLFIVGIAEVIDTLISKDAKDFFYSLQNSLLDLVVSILILFTVGDEPLRLSLLIAGFLMIKGGFRIILSFAPAFTHGLSTRIGAILSIALGLTIALSNMPAGWFLSFCLSVEIALRGWSMTFLGLSLKRKNHSV